MPLSLGLRQIVTCKTPMRNLCAGFDMMISFLIEFSASTIEALQAQQEAAGEGRRKAECTGQAKCRGSRRETALAALPARRLLQGAVSQGHGGGGIGVKGISE